MATTDRHGFLLWASGFKQSDTLLNDLLQKLEVKLNLSVKSMTETAPLGGDSDGDCYIMPGGTLTGAFSGFSQNQVVILRDSVWYAFTPIRGWVAEVQDTGAWRGFNGSAWAAITSGAEFSDSLFRIQDNADATKQLAFEVSAVGTGNTRTVTMPDEDVTLGPPEGTAIKSTGEEGGTKFLRENGDGTCSWQEGAGGLNEAQVDARVVAGSDQKTFTETINDDAVLVITLDDQLFAGSLIISTNHSSTAGALLRIRASDSLALCTIIAASTGFGATTGVLTGTTSPDAAITVSTHTDRKIYIQNRIGSNQTFSVTLCTNEYGSI